MPSRLVRRIHQGTEHPEDGVAMVLALFVILVAAALSIGIAGATLAQVKPTQLAQKNVRTVHAAEAGLDASLGRIRAAKTANAEGSVFGDISKLPCAAKGTVGPDQGNLTYASTIAYYSADPTGKDNNTAWQASHRITCTTGLGTASIPLYALITSVGAGTDAPGQPNRANRTLKTVYDFSTTNENVLGGLVNIYGDTTVCLEATGTAAGSLVKTDPCDPTEPLQVWSYKNDLSFMLTSTKTPANTGMCVEAVGNGTQLKLQVCGMPTTVSLPKQQWSYTGSGHIRATSDSVHQDGPCWKTVGGYLQLDNAACNSSYTATTTYIPHPEAGAGRAGESAAQLVNFKEFGRCLDMTNHDKDANWIILWTCKQLEVETNQKWYFANGKIWGGEAGASYCLQPNATGVKSGAWLVLRNPCTATKSWVFNRDAPSDYSKKWTVVYGDTNLCMSIASSPAATSPWKNSSYDVSLLPWSIATLETCDGTAKQKWNAPPDTGVAAVNNTYEKTGP